MTQDQTPSLRFPEFRGAWEIKPLAEMCSKIPQGGTPDTTKPDYWNGSINWLTPAEMGKTKDRFMHTTVRKITELGLKKCSSDLLPINSIIVSTRAPIGYLTINKTEMAFNQGCKGLIPKEETDYNFLYYCLLNSKYSLIDLGSGSTFKELAGNDLKKFKIFFPSLTEQKKIAECLSSLDEVITIHGDRLDGLKDYKRGLMQQLFPTDGQTTPTLRFREFQGKAPWKKKRLNEVLNSISNGLNLEQVKEVTSYKVTRIETISNDVINTEKVGYIKPEQDISSYKLNIGDMLYSNINSLSHIGRVVIIDRDYNLYHGMNLLRLVVDKNLNNPQFIYYLLNTEEIKLSFKSRANPAVNQASINQTELSKTRIIVPPPAEQQKIADCLSVMDELITEQEQKIKTLKHHKNGLMQQLFPKL